MNSVYLTRPPFRAAHEGAPAAARSSMSPPPRRSVRARGSAWYNASKGWMVTATNPWPSSSPRRRARQRHQPGGRRDAAAQDLHGRGHAGNPREVSGDDPARPVSRRPRTWAMPPCFLCSDEASMITGVALEVDGGPLPVSRPHPAARAAQPDHRRARHQCRACHRRARGHRRDHAGCARLPLRPASMSRGGAPASARATPSHPTAWSARACHRARGRLRVRPGRCRWASPPRCRPTASACAWWRAPTPFPSCPAAVLHDLAHPGDKAWGLSRPIARWACRAWRRPRRTSPRPHRRRPRRARRPEPGGIGSGLDRSRGRPGRRRTRGGECDRLRVHAGWPQLLGLAIRDRWGVRRPAARPRPRRRSPTRHRPIPASPRWDGAVPAADPARAPVIGVLATSARLTTAECRRVAMMAHDGLARAVRPAHTPFDGDTLFAVSTGTCSAPGHLTRGGAGGAYRLGRRRLPGARHRTGRPCGARRARRLNVATDPFGNAVTGGTPERCLRSTTSSAASSATSRGCSPYSARPKPNPAPA